LVEDVWDNLLTLLLWPLVLGLLYLPVLMLSLISLPLAVLLAAVTVAPGLAGLLLACGNAARGGFCRLTDAVRGAFRLYTRSAALALPLSLLVALTLTTSDIVRAFPDRTELLLAWALQIGVCLCGALLHLYLLPALALYHEQLSLKQTAMLAAGLAGRFPAQTIALLIVGIALLAAPLLHVLVWLAVPGLWCVLITNATWRLARRVAPELGRIDK
jgi:hypothetical protein